MRRRFVAELAVVISDAELLNQSKRGEELRLAKDRFRENLFVKMIQVPGPEPDQISQENRRRDDNGDNNPEKIFQDGLKHPFTSRVERLTVNKNFRHVKHTRAAPNPCYSHFVTNEHNHIDKPEPRWQALLAFIAVAAIYLALPRALIIGPIWLLPSLILVLLVPTVMSHRTGKRSLNRVLGT